MSGFTEKQIISIVVVGTFATLLLVAFLVSFVYFYQRRHFAFLREKQQIRSQFQEELLKTRLEIQEETFKSISEEIHDNIGQTLSFIKLNLNTMQIILPEKENAKWVESKELLTKVIQDLRSLSRTLNTDFIQDIGLANAVKQQLTLLERSGVYEIGFSISGEKRHLPASRELVLYRVVQELLNNVVKHADASAVSVVMNYQQDQLIVSITDNGKGFEPELLARGERSGMGLRIVQNRITLIDGTVQIQSAPGSGTNITINLSITNEV